MNSKLIKQNASELGADLCGIANIDSFMDAPKGFSPSDFMPTTESVIAFALQTPKTTLYLDNKIAYTVTENELMAKSNKIAIKLMLLLEAEGYEASIVPSEPYDYWDSETQTGKGLLSLKHIGQKCGLGVFGKNHLLYNPKYGNLIKLGAVVTNAILNADEILKSDFCKPSCNLCIKNCPANAISKHGVNQLKCRKISNRKTLKGDVVYECTVCRRVCVNVNGTDKA